MVSCLFGRKSKFSTSEAGFRKMHQLCVQSIIWWKMCVLCHGSRDLFHDCSSLTLDWTQTHKRRLICRWSSQCQSYVAMAMQIVLCTMKYRRYKTWQPTQGRKSYCMKSLKIDLDYKFDILEVELLPSLGHTVQTKCLFKHLKISTLYLTAIKNIQ